MRRCGIFGLVIPAFTGMTFKPRRKAVSIEIVEEDGKSFVLRKFADHGCPVTPSSPTKAGDPVNTADPAMTRHH